MRDIIGHGGKGGEAHTHYEAQDSLHNTSYARVLDLVSEGEILGLASGLQSVYLNQTPVENADGTTNFTNITVDFRTGTQDQDYIAGFPDIENEVSVGVELKSGTPWVRAISNTALSGVRITLGVPALSKADTTNGDILGHKVDYQIELSKDGGAYSVVVSNSFSGKTTSEYQRSTRIDLPPATTGWQIRVTRLTPNAGTVGIADTTMIISYTEVIDAKLRYPMSAIVGVQVDAKQFQSIPTRAYDLFGRIIQVPSNYDPIARTYAGVWDGTFKPAWTNNPAWVFRDLVLHDRYGLGHRITASQVDKWALYKIARYCDELVPDGKGGTEPRFTCNLYLQSRKQAYAVLQDIASIFRGISYWGAGSIFASSDMPADPVYVYTAANVISGKFTRTGSRKATRYTVALVTWNDPADFFKQKVEYVEDPEGIARYGLQQVELTAFGCTSQGQAQRAGRWALATSRLETEGINFDVGMDGAIALPGQIVRVADPSRMGKRAGGRVRTAAGRVVTLDKAPVISAGDKLTVILPTGVSETRTVSSVAGDAVTVDSDWTAVPVAQSVWSVDSNELSAPLFRVLSVTEKDPGTFTITAVQHEPGKYDFVENGVAITSRVQTSLDVTKQAPPAAVTLLGYTITLEADQKLALQISCAVVPGAVGYEGAYRRGNDNWIAIPRQAGPSMDVRDVPAGRYVAKMWAINSVGIASVETLSANVDVNPNTAVPLVVNVGAAKAAADAANAAIAAISDDNVLSKSEKPGIMQLWSAASDEYQGVALQADSLGVSRATYDSTFTALRDFIVSISPAYNNLTQDSSVAGATMRAKFGDYYLARQTLLNTIAAKAATLSTWVGVTGPGKPQDNATVGANAGNFNATIGGDNLVNNSSFETRAANFRPHGFDLYNNANTPTVFIDAAGRIGGKACAIRAAGSAATNNWGFTTGLTIVEGNTVGGVTGGWQPNKTYVVSFKARKVNGAGFGKCALQWNTNPVTTDVLNPVLSTAWQTYAFRLVWGASVEGFGRMFIDRLGAIATGDEFHIDELIVQEGDVYSEWFPSSREAQAAADQANTAIANISNDNVLSRGEKSDVIRQWQTIVAEQITLDAQADALAVDRTLYDNAEAALGTYLANLNPAWSDTTQDTPIDGPTFRSKFNTLYSEKQKLVSAIAAKAATLSTWGGVTGTGKPADNASSDITLVGRGITVTGNTLTKTGNVDGSWDSDAYSVYGYAGGAFAEAVVVQTNAYLMFGLNDDPLTNAGFNTLDFAMYCQGNGTVTAWENGGGVAVDLGPYAVGDVLTLAYDGSTVRYLKNGAVLRSVSANFTAPLYFDSTFRDRNSSLKNVRFGPMSSNNWSSIGGNGKPQDNATVGAPTGTNVGSTPATTVESNAAAGAAAAGQVSSTKSVSGLYNVTGMNNQTNNVQITVATFTASASGMNGSVTFTWSIQKDQGTLLTLSASSGATVSVYAKGNNNRASGTVICTASDSKGFTAMATCYIDVGFGSGVPA